MLNLERGHQFTTRGQGRERSDVPRQLVRLCRRDGDARQAEGVAVEGGGGLECPVRDGEIDVCYAGDERHSVGVMCDRFGRKRCEVVEHVSRHD